MNPEQIDLFVSRSTSLAQGRVSFLKSSELSCLQLSPHLHRHNRLNSLDFANKFSLAVPLGEVQTPLFSFDSCFHHRVFIAHLSVDFFLSEPFCFLVTKRSISVEIVWIRMLFSLSAANKTTFIRHNFDSCSCTKGLHRTRGSCVAAGSWGDRQERFQNVTNHLHTETCKYGSQI